MNKSYRVVWNASTSTWCAASEIARGRSKSSRSAKSKIAAATALVVASMGSAYADETEPVDPTLDDPVRVSEAKPSDPEIMKRDVPTTRIVVPDTTAYVKINAKGDGSDGASALGENSVAIGSNASTRAGTSGLGGAVAVGNKAAAVGDGVALGGNASATGDVGSLALGSGSNASGKSSIAIGYGSRASATGAYALGRTSEASAQSALAIGEMARATREGTTAIGYHSVVDADDALALGAYSEAHRSQTVSVGTDGFERQIVNVGRGTQATDAVNIAQLKDVTTTLGGNAAVDANGNIKKPAYTIGSKTYDNVGDALLAASESGGGSENAVEYDSTAKNSVTLGGTGSAAVKLTNVRAATLSANSTDAVNGAQLFATNNRVTNVEQSLTDSGLIDPSTGESLAVVYKDATKSTVALGGTGGTTVTNVKAGKVASASKDAVNGGQLYDVSSSVASALGGDAAVNTDGTLSKPTYKVGDKTYNNVGDALQAAASSGGAGGEDANAVHYDGAGKSSVTLGGTTATKPVALKNVATGTADTDAVNVAQLQGGLSDVKDEIRKDLGDGTLDMKYIKVNATGMQANALGKNSVAIGSTANATNVNTLAIGSGARATGVNSIAIGVNSVATDVDTLSVGDVGDTRRIVNVSDGIDAHDAVTMKQLTDAMHTANTQLDQKMTRMTRDVSAKPGSFVAVEGVGADGSLPAVASMNGRDPTLGTAAAIGVSSAAGGTGAIAVGLQAAALSDRSVAIGSIAQTGVDQEYSVAIGSKVTTNGPGALAIGSRAKANGENAVAVGNNGVMAIGKSSIAMGDKATTMGGTVNSIAIGTNATVNQNVADAVALGANSKALQSNSVALGANSVADRSNALSVGSNSLQRQIVNVAKGTTNNDAVNVSQLRGVTNALGGGAGIDTDGTIKAPTYKVGDTTYNNVGDALDAMAKNGGSDPNAVAYDSETKDKVTLAGKTGTTLTNLNAGKVSADSKDAVNGSQLYGTAKSVADVLGGGSTVDESGKVKAPTYTLVDPADDKKKVDYHTVGDALENLDGRVAGNTGDITNIKNQFKDTGLVDADGDTRAAVVYDKNKDGTPNYKSATLAGDGGTTLSNVAAGKADTDAVNVSQLKSSGLIDGDGKSIAAVTYDKNTDGTPNHESVTLAGKTGTKLTNVKAAELSATSTDAVNGSQLFATNENLGNLKDALTDGGVIDEKTGESLAVVYDSTSKDKVTLAGKTGTTLSNVKAGTADLDAVNVSQLKSSGLIDGDGKSIAAVTYDKKTDGTPNYNSVTLGGGKSTGPVTLSNVAQGKANTDAVNVEQLTKAISDVEGGMNPLAVSYDTVAKDKVTLAGEKGTTLTNVAAGKVSADSKDAINGAQLHGTAQSMADALGGGATVDENGKLKAPTYTLADPADDTKKVDYHTVGDALENLDGRVAGNTGDITHIKNQFTNTGLVDADGDTRAAVVYDKNKDGTPNYKSATLAGDGGTTLSNVAAGKADTDAVNVSQLKSSGLIDGDGKSIAAVTYDRNKDGTPNYSSVTLGGGKSAGPVTLSNVAKGQAGTDAVNVDQLTDAIRDVEGGMNPLAVSYDSTAHDKVTLKGVGGTTLSNVKAGKADTDAVNVSQLKSSGLIDGDGKALAAVTYDKNADGTPNYKSATLAGGEGGTKLSNVAAGTKDMDAVNVSQLKSSGLVGEDGKSRAAVTYDKNADGTPNYKSATLAGEGGTKLSNVAAGTKDMDAVNVSQLKSSGLVGEDGKSRAAVTYDKNADGTPNFKSATLTGEGGTTLSNVKAGTADTDAVNVSQLKSSGLVGEDGKSRAALTYDKNADGTPNYKLATLAGEGGTKLSNVADGKADKDAVNVSQLKSSGLIDGDGKALAALTYDKNADGTPNYKLATLAGEGGTKLSNVADGKADKDAVNVSQLKSSGLIDDDGKSIAALTYDRNKDGTPNYKSATLAGVGGTTLSNVADGKADKDAVNVSQLKSSGLIDGDGKSLAAVTYDRNKDGTPNYKSATLAGVGGTTLTNVKAAELSATSTDAVNGSQLFATNENLGNLKDTLTEGGVIDEKTGESLAVVYDSTSKDKVTLSGEKGTTLTNVKAGTADLDAVNVSQLKSSGLIDGDGKSIAAVTYDRNTDGTPNYNSVTLGGGKSTGPVTLSNVAKGQAGTDAVNVDQLDDMYDRLTNGAIDLKYIKVYSKDGLQANALGRDSVAIGPSAVATESYTLALGSGARANGAYSVAIGANSVADDDHTVSVGDVEATRRIVHVSDGIDAHDAVTVKQLTDAMHTANTEFDQKMTRMTRDVSAKPGTFVAVEGVGADGSLPAVASMNGRDPTLGTAAAIGVSSAAGGTGAIAVGLKAAALSDHSVAIGSVAQTGVDQEYSVAIGSKVTTNGPGALAIGSRAKANGENAVAVGNNGVMAIGKSSIAMGDKATTMGGTVNSIAIGTNATVNQNVADAVALGANSKALQSNSVALGANSLADRANALSIGSAGAERQIVHVAKGTQNTDAVNLSQLKGLADVVGGGTGFDANGDVTAPTYTIDGKEYHNVNDALQAAAKSGGDGSSGTDPNAVAYDGEQKDKVTLAGQNGTTLSNVAAGKADTDAVNVSQLKSSGLIGENGKALAAVTYDTHADGTTNFASVTFGGMNAGVPVALHNVAAGTASTDAVNVSQLKGVTDIIGGGAGLDADGKVTAPVYNVDGKDYASVGDAIKALEQREGGTGNGTNPNAVVYDNSTKAAVTLAGANGTVLRNVADGSLAENSTEAVNGGQVNYLAQSIAESLGGGAKFDPATGDISAPTYELTAADGLTNTYDNVGDAFKHVDERVSTHTTQIETLQKGVANAVQYDDATHASVTLGGGGAKPVMLKNVADGVDETDAVNVRQLRSAGLVGEDGKLQSAVVYDKNEDGTTNYGSVTLGGVGATTPVALHNVAAGKAKTDAVNVSQLSGVTDALGGGAKIDEEGKVVAPTYNVGGDTFHNAGDALHNIDNRVTQIQDNLGEATKLVGAVAYDKNADGTVNFGKVTLGNGQLSGPVVLTNVADGKSDYDAVNYGQYSKLEGRVNDIDDRLTALPKPPKPGDESGNTGGSNDLIHGTGGSGKDKADVVAAKPGNGNGNIAVGSDSQIVDGKNNATAIGAGSKVSADDGTALGHGASVSSSATNSVALGSGSKATEANTVSIGSDGHERRLVNVADAVNKTDAVNKGQLDRAIGGMQGQINDMSRNAYSGIAAATALTMIPGVDPGKTLSFGIGGGSYKGYQAVAMGGEARITENLKMRAGVGLSSGGNTFGVGASYQW